MSSSNDNKRDPTWIYFLKRIHPALDSGRECPYRMKNTIGDPFCLQGDYFSRERVYFPCKYLGEKNVTTAEDPITPKMKEDMKRIADKEIPPEEQELNQFMKELVDTLPEDITLHMWYGCKYTPKI